MKHLGIMNVLLMVVQVAGHVFMMLLIRHICCWYHLTDDNTVVISSNNASDPQLPVPSVGYFAAFSCSRLNDICGPKKLRVILPHTLGLGGLVDLLKISPTVIW